MFDSMRAAAAKKRKAFSEMPARLRRKAAEKAKAIPGQLCGFAWRTVRDASVTRKAAAKVSSVASEARREVSRAIQAVVRFVLLALAAMALAIIGLISSLSFSARQNPEPPPTAPAVARSAEAATPVSYAPEASPPVLLAQPTIEAPPPTQQEPADETPFVSPPSGMAATNYGSPGYGGGSDYDSGYSSGPVHVRGYMKANGTYVQSYNRSAPTHHGAAAGYGGHSGRAGRGR